METIELAFRFLNSYPVWAKACVVTGVVFSILVLVFAPRSSGQNDAPPQRAVLQPPPPKTGFAVIIQPVERPIFLTIKGIKLFPDDPNVEVQVRAIVNGTTFVHPSVGGVKWMKVGPDMSEKRIELPRSDRYDIRFEMTLRNGGSFVGTGAKRLEAEHASQTGSQLVRTVWQLPFSEEYKLYDIVGQSRAPSVRATVSYTVSQDQ